MNRKSPISHDITRTTLQVLSIAMLICAGLLILRPFLTSIIWAAMIVIATWPILLWLQTKLGDRRGLAVTVMTFTILLAVVLPLALAITAIIRKGDDVAVVVKSLTSFTLPPAPEWLGHIPFVGPKLVDRWQHIASLRPEELGEYFAPRIQQGLEWLAAQAGSFALIFFQFLLTVIIAAILYAKGETAASGILMFANRLSGKPGEDVAVLAAKAVRGVALGVVLTALIQTSFAGIGLAVTGVPAAALLTAVIFVFCLAQIGPALVLIPVNIWLYWKDGALWGSILLVFSVLAVTLDNFIRPVLIKKGADLPLVLIFAGVIGGLITFGIIGLFIGPVVLAVIHTLLKVWVIGDISEDAVSAKGEDEP
jgi:predicted PurR-regulated permease PerM